MHEDFCFNDGGRAIHFNRPFTGDCVTRAIAIAFDEYYWKIWQDLSFEKKQLKLHNADHGVPNNIIFKYLEEHNWKLCYEHNKQEDKTKLLFNTSNFLNNRYLILIHKHLTVIIDGVLHDTYYSIGKGKRTVQAYWTPA